MNRELDQELVAKACISLARAEIFYAQAGPKDMALVANYITKALHHVSDKLTEENQEEFAKWVELEKAKMLKGEGDD